MKKNQLKRKLRNVILILSLSLPITMLAQESPKLTDPEIAHVGVTANKIDIGYAEIAIKMSSNKDIITFAETMKRDHEGVIKQAVDLVTKLGVTPKENNVSSSMLKDAEEMKKKLKSKKGEDFDKSYINNEVAYHKAVIAAIRDILVPQSNNQELKDFLNAILPALETHLKHAEMVQEKVN